MLNIKTSEAVITDIYDDIWLKKNISLSLLRLDIIHPIVSGNKIFKLRYFLQKAVEQNLKIITFGGAYSNHLAATAAACKYCGVRCIGIVRGERPLVLSSTLSYCLQQGMQLEFISRNDYKRKEENVFNEDLQSTFGDHILIPEGGFSEDGLKGAAEIYKYVSGKSYTHICCSVGTGTTLAGLIHAAQPSQQILGFSALKDLNCKERLAHLLNPLPENFSCINDYHFGGYAKTSDELIDFMNSFYAGHSVPLDFVYTGKMMYGIIDMIKQNYFAEKSDIICIHTGGLQGNSSLKPGELFY